MHWEKKGLIYAPTGELSWAQQYAFPPTPYRLDDHTIRLYLASCDNQMVGRVGYVDVNADDPSQVISVAKTPVLDIGEPGDFDENGVLPTCVVPVGDALFMYYVGYQIGQKVRYYQFCGLAISTDGGRSFERHQRVPILDRSDLERHHRTSAFVLHDSGVFRMWYTAGSTWTLSQGKSCPIYNLHYLESADGIHWPSSGPVCLDFNHADEHALGRPWVMRDEDRYRLWYSRRDRINGYRLGYAESADGVSWQRLDDRMNLDVSDQGWDSSMLCYSSVFPHKDRMYLFYNGNDCGRTGFGYAISWRT